MGACSQAEQNHASKELWMFSGCEDSTLCDSHVSVPRRFRKEGDDIDSYCTLSTGLRRDKGICNERSWLLIASNAAD